MKVLFLSSWYPNRTAPYNGDFVERHAIAVSKICTTSVLHVIPDDNPACPLLEITEVRKDNLYEVIVYFRRFTRWPAAVNRALNYSFYVIGYCKGYLKIKKALGKPDIIHANVVFNISVVAWIFGLISGIPYIISEHWTLFLTKKPSEIKGRMVRFAAKRAFALVPVSSNLRDAMIKHGFDNDYRIVPNVVDTNLFRLRKANNQVRRFLHVSSMKEEQKNISGILRTLHRLRLSGTDFTFTFAGEVQADQLSLADSLGLLNHRVIFRGMLNHPQVAKLMQESDVLVMFSRFENLPCVILEALSCGIPIISTDVGGISEWINEQNGVLIKEGDEDALYEALITMMEEQDKFDPENLRNYAIEHFAREFIKIYEQALKQ